MLRCYKYRLSETKCVIRKLIVFHYILSYGCVAYALWSIKRAGKSSQYSTVETTQHLLMNNFQLCMEGAGAQCVRIYGNQMMSRFVVDYSRRLWRKSVGNCTTKIAIKLSIILLHNADVYASVCFVSVANHWVRIYSVMKQPCHTTGVWLKRSNYKEFVKSANIWRSYVYSIWGSLFFGPPCRVITLPYVTFGRAMLATQRIRTCS